MIIDLQGIEVRVGRRVRPMFLSDGKTKVERKVYTVVDNDRLLSEDGVYVSIYPFMKGKVFLGDVVK